MAKFTKTQIAMLDNNKPEGEVIAFQNPYTFRAIDQALKHAQNLGYSVGRMQAGSPIALFKGEADISKWRNLSFDSQADIDGAIVGDVRNGPVYLCFPKE